MPLLGQRILLVEDENIIAFDVMNIIRGARGDVVGHARSLAAAMKLADTPKLSLAILDFSLGSDNSLPVAAKLHAAGVPFIFHTGSDVSAVSQAWPRVPVVSKPASAEALVSALAPVASLPHPPRRTRLDAASL
jgi:DNA-binding NarL/FixJ family response regulator